MSEWAARRFWTDAAVTREEAGFGITLDGRPVRSPGKAPLLVPTAPLAEAIAAEWRAQGERIAPQSMPFTRSANAAIDKVAPQYDAVAAMLAEYGDSDLLCYRADRPEELTERQRAAWDPLLDWAEAAYGARLLPYRGVMYQPQPADALARLAAELRRHDAFGLTALHDLVSLSGSLVLGLAAARDARPIDDLWALSRLDETWQEELWGVDDEARAAAEARRIDFLHAKRFLTLSLGAN